MKLAQPNPLSSDCEVSRSSVSTPVRGAGAGCQQGADTKVVKGKGGAGRSLREVQAEMLKLAAETKAVEGRVLFLEVHRRRQTGQTSLRWRLVPGGWRHVKWEDRAMQEVLTRQALIWRDWYVRANVMAQELNREERALRGVARDQVRHVEI